MEQLQKLIDEYVKWTEENRMAGKKIAVYLGLQVEQSPKHAAFYEAVGEWAKTFAAGQPEHGRIHGLRAQLHRLYAGPAQPLQRLRIHTVRPGGQPD